GLGEVEVSGDRAVDGHRGSRRKARAATGTADAVQVARLAQFGVRRGDRGAADLELLGEFAFCWDAGTHLDATVEDQEADAVGEGGIGGRASGPPPSTQ